MECIHIQVDIIKLSPYKEKKKIIYQIWSLKSGFFKTLSRIFWMRFFFSRHGAYQWSSSLGRGTSCIRHFVLMCCLLTFSSHLNNTFFFLPIFFGEFWQKHYASMWGHYGSRVMGVYLRPLSEALGLTTNLFWWYRPFIYGRLCPIYFSRELGFGGSIYVL